MPLDVAGEMVIGKLPYEFERRVSQSNACAVCSEHNTGFVCNGADPAPGEHAVDSAGVVAHQQGAAVVDIGRDSFDFGPSRSMRTPDRDPRSDATAAIPTQVASQEIIVGGLEGGREIDEQLTRSKVRPKAMRSEVARSARSGGKSWPFTFKPMPTTMWRTASPVVAISVRMPAALRNSPPQKPADRWASASAVLPRRRPARAPGLRQPAG